MEVTEQITRRLLKPVVFVAGLVPAGSLAWAAVTGHLSANPLSDITNVTGDWTLRFLCITLAITPLRRLTGWNRLIRFRRMLGLYAFFYGTLHFLTYVIFDRFAGLDFSDGIVSWTTVRGLTESIASDIYKRPFITVGFTTFVAMLPLAATSTAGMIRRLGGRQWQALHRLIYLSAIAAVLHYWWLVKADIRRPAMYATIVGVLLAYRVYWARARARPASATARRSSLVRRILMRKRSVDRLWWRSWIGFAIVGCLLSPGRAAAQPAASGPLSLNDAVQLALKNYPAIKESRARAQAADEGIGVARTAYLPRLDMLWQENRATTNNVFGLMLPQSVVPPISGPVLGTRSYDSVWGSAAGVQLSWEALDFGQRKANVEVARAQSSFAKARADLTALDVAAAAADAFVTVLAADQAVGAARANVDRLQVFADNVRTLVANQLRPGADESRANAELAIARNQLSQAVQTADIARAALADAVGAAGTTVEPVASGLANLPQVSSLAPGDFISHPAARADLAVVDTVRARERVLDRSYFPHVYFQSTFAARDSGAQVPGQPPPDNGLWPQVPNWAAGLQVTFPAFDLFTVNARKRVEVQNELAERARYDQTIQTLTTQDVRARALIKAALAIAQNTPIERQAATAAESQARARYGSGLASITEVAEAQRLLAQAEADDAVARLGVWRAVLAAAQVRGDLTPFLERTRQP